MALLTIPQSVHIRVDDIPWIQPAGSRGAYRIIHARPDDGLFIRQTRAAPGQVSGLHRHSAPVLAFTNSGAWGHDANHIEYTAGSYVYEEVGVIHRFYNGPEITEATFVQMGDVEWFDEAGKEIVRVETAHDAVRSYLEACDAAGVPRPNILV